MKIAAITRFKHGVIYEALNKLGWTQIELARRTGIHQSRISAYLNLRCAPSEAAARRIQNAFGEAGLFVDVENAWPEGFKGLARAPVIAEVREVADKLFLQDETGLSQHALGYTVQFDGLTMPDLQRFMEEVLSERERIVLEARFYEGKTLDEVARKLGLQSREHIRLIQNEALKKLRACVERDDHRYERERNRKALEELAENARRFRGEQDQPSV